MNCNEFRCLLMIDPRRGERRFLDHMRECPQCVREAERVWELEEKLRAALVAAPASGHSQTSTAHPRLQQWALASRLLLALSLSIWLGIRWGFWMQPQLAAVVLEHIENEPDALQLDQHLAAEKVAPVLGELGGRLSANPGPIRYAKCCPILGGRGVHLVVAGARGPITVLIMPGRHVAERHPLDSLRFQGIIAPTDYGSIAVVGERREPLEAVVERMSNAVTWKPVT